MQRKIGLRIALVLSIGLIYCVGCKPFEPFNSDQIPLKDDSQSRVPMYRVEMMNSMGGAAVHTGKIAEAATVQGALEQSGALRRFRGARIDLYRFVPEKRTVLKLPVELQPGKRLVRVDQDYALLPGDRIVVRGRSPFGNDD